jgi:hypothetical protein
MRETRQSGSEGGAAGKTGCPYPYCTNIMALIGGPVEPGHDVCESEPYVNSWECPNFCV